jgi:hypothetical protein
VDLERPHPPLARGDTALIALKPPPRDHLQPQPGCCGHRPEACRSHERQPLSACQLEVMAHGAKARLAVQHEADDVLAVPSARLARFDYLCMLASDTARDCLIGAILAHRGGRPTQGLQRPCRSGAPPTEGRSSSRWTRGAYGWPEPLGLATHQPPFTKPVPATHPFPRATQIARSVRRGLRPSARRAAPIDGPKQLFRIPPDDEGVHRRGAAARADPSSISTV